jgi:hypothetical protein
MECGFLGPDHGGGMSFLPQLAGFAKSTRLGWRVFDQKKLMRNMGLMSRALWHVNRSPLRYAVKTGVGAWNLNEKLERRRQAQLLDVSEREKASTEGLIARVCGCDQIDGCIRPAAVCRGGPREALSNWSWGFDRWSMPCRHHRIRQSLGGAW